MFVEMAVADAYAIAWEFTNKQVAKNDLTSYHQHPTYQELTPGQYTDDTQRAIGNARVLLSNDSTAPIRHEAYAESYLLTYREDPREGYSRGFQAFLKETTTASDFLLKVQRTKVSNGSLMGVAPLGFIPDLATLKLAAMVQATTTHHPETAIHAQLVAMMVHYFVHIKSPRAEMTNWLVESAPWVSDSGLEFTWLDLVSLQRKGLKTGIKASSISSYVAYAVQNLDSLQSIILDAVNRGGDTDSAAACAVAVASCCPEIIQNIPQVLVDTLEPKGKHGVEYLQTIELELRKKAGLL